MARRSQSRNKNQRGIGVHKNSATQNTVESVLKVFIAFGKWPEMARMSILFNIVWCAFIAWFAYMGIEYDGAQENLLEALSMTIGVLLSTLVGLYCLTITWYAPAVILIAFGALNTYVFPVYVI